MEDKDIQQIRNFNRFYTDLLGLLDSRLLESQYSLAEARILFEINSNGESRASDLIDRLNMDKGYLSRILKKFERDGLVQRNRSNLDGRVYLLSLSDNGKAVFLQLDASSNQQIQKLVAHLHQKDLPKLLNCMREIIRILR